jgi:hypothetical protein
MSSSSSRSGVAAPAFEHRKRRVRRFAFRLRGFARLLILDADPANCIAQAAKGVTE